MTDFNKIKQGDVFSRTSYGKVVANKGTSLIIENEKKLQWQIDKNIVESEFSFADSFSETKKMTRTELIELFKNNSRVAVTVNFNKKVDQKAVKDRLYELYPNKGSILSEAQFKKEVGKVVKEALEGEERTMRGYHVGSQDDTGRFYFQDLDVADGRPRQVDPRTINWVIVDNVKYEVK